MSFCANIPEEFTIHWKVTNFDACFLHNHESFDSPSFSLNNFCNTRWYLRLSLESHCKYGFEYVCALVREYDDGPTSIGVYCRVSCFSETLTESFQTFTKGSKYDFPVPELYDFDKFPQMSSLVFKCEMYFNFVDEKLSGNSVFTNHFQSCCLKPDLSKVLKENPPKNLMNADKIKTYPKQGFASSRYLVEKRIFSLPLRDFVLDKEGNMQKILATSFTDMPSISMEFSVINEDDFDYLKINFLLVEAKLKSNLLLYSEISFVDSNLNTLESGRDYHLFRYKHTVGTWSFGHFFDWNQIKLKADDSNKLLFNCQLFFFDGQLQSEIVWMADFDRILAFSDRKTHANETNVETVNQTKFLDADIWNNQANILPLLPIFSPNIEKLVDLEYLNLETVNQKIRTKFSECLEQTGLDNNVRTYSMAKKFQMLSLKRESRKFLEENLDVGNLCEILIVANSSQNKELYDSAVEFVSFHKNRILKSSTWENFAENNYKLAMKILTDVCITLPEKNFEL